MLAPSLKYAFHPYLPERLGFRRVLRIANPDVARVLDQTDSYTLSPARSRTTLLREGCTVLRNRVKGDFAEFGVHRGGSAAVLAHAIRNEPKRHLHLFDKWDDRPEPTDEDGFRKDQYATMTPERRAKIEGAFEATRTVVERVVGFPEERLHYYPGWFDDTLNDWPGTPIAFASIDCDIYKSVKPVLALCDRYAAPGATLVVDDYGTWPGAKLAVHEWLGSTKRRAELITFWRMPNAIIRLR